MKLYRSILTGLIISSTHLIAGGDKLFFGPCSAFSTGMKFDCYRDYEEVVQFSLTS